MMENLELIKKNYETVVIRKDQAYEYSNKLQIQNNQLKIKVNTLEGQVNKLQEGIRKNSQDDKFFKELKDTKVQLEGKINILEEEKRNKLKEA